MNTGTCSKTVLERHLVIFDNIFTFIHITTTHRLTTLIEKNNLLIIISSMIKKMKIDIFHSV